MTRALIPAALAATLFAGCGSTHHEGVVQNVPQTVVQTVPESPSPVLACIARRAPTGAIHERPGALTVDWPDGEVLLVSPTASTAAAKRAVAKVRGEQSAHSTGVIAKDYGDTVVEWSPRAPTAEEAAVLHGCVS